MFRAINPKKQRYSIQRYFNSKPLWANRLQSVRNTVFLHFLPNCYQLGAVCYGKSQKKIIDFTENRKS
ncbi:MAG: hypothetical protein EBT66_06305 [Bacteroidetes bacterium]|nr:hypothetical protein [Bacteroidota bacterium]NBX64552.1 hypothetical protein [Bacteroidota bacterium]